MEKQSLSPLEEMLTRRAKTEEVNVKAVESRHQKGILTARERVEALVDPGSFMEIDRYALHKCQEFGMADKKHYGDGVITGQATIDGKAVYLFAHDATFVGGALGEVFARKVCKVMDLAYQAGCPVIGLNESGGARIQEGVRSLAGYADIFYRNVKSSGVIPQISVIYGACAGGAVYSPAVTDFTIMVKDKSFMFVTGPEIVRTVTGEDVTLEELGGAMTHNRKSGVAQLLAEDEADSFHLTKRLLSFLPSNNLDPVPLNEDFNPPSEEECAELDAIVPVEATRPYDMHHVIERIFDDGDFFEISPHFAGNILTGFARLGGHSVGIVANQPRILAGCLDINASVKAARFVRFLDAFNIPVITFVDVPGYLPGTHQEYSGIIRHGAKLLYAYCEATVPKLTVITRKAYGGAFDVMGSKNVGGDFNFAWPTAEIAVVGAEAAVNLLYRKELKEDQSGERFKTMVSEFKNQFANPYIASQEGYIDDVIKPSETREKLLLALNVQKNKRVERPRRKHGNIPL
ncbi:MAG: acyl-CoA carboxylase subunit beta [Candidatus Obscuribacter phosphatis]|uniref:Acyl-CoA carboxylase subunit beta n=1 Tax=Candidatus Obscuribacter phosphatis TaxID=1906157 RepID=A0A8J7TPT3_9BACT|nr:acyl-CoA carboxylase subunit beta [Candidatus Obscuribacter phosphatis]